MRPVLLAVLVAAIAACVGGVHGAHVRGAGADDMPRLVDSLPHPHVLRVGSMVTEEAHAIRKSYAASHDELAAALRLKEAAAANLTASIAQEKQALAALQGRAEALKEAVAQDDAALASTEQLGDAAVRHIAHARKAVKARERTAQRAMHSVEQTIKKHRALDKQAQQLSTIVAAHSGDYAALAADMRTLRRVIHEHQLQADELVDKRAASSTELRDVLLLLARYSAATTAEYHGRLKKKRAVVAHAEAEEAACQADLQALTASARALEQKHAEQADLAARDAAALRSVHAEIAVRKDSVSRLHKRLAAVEKMEEAAKKAAEKRHALLSTQMSVVHDIGDSLSKAAGQLTSLLKDSAADDE
eukprot:PLAT1591.1.p1 GENE.PLAT1591.1~~PLAT1591.1.p1  ORF type:complete len:361 (-),score=181.22 PLAT1591.1:466-1548(-)